MKKLLSNMERFGCVVRETAVGFLEAYPGYNKVKVNTFQALVRRELVEEISPDAKGRRQWAISAKGLELLQKEREQWDRDQRQRLGA